MATITIKVEVLDRDGRTVETDYAHGNTLLAAKSAAGGLARTMKYQHEEHPLGPVTTKIHRAVRRARADHPAQVEVGDRVYLIDASGRHDGTVTSLSYRRGLVMVKWDTGMTERVPRDELTLIEPG
jgi:hypothetical protein